MKFPSGSRLEWSFALIKILVHLPVLSRFGYHQDELYFLACGEHLSFGYVDHAPLVPWIARLADTLFGQSLFGLRIFATLAGAGAVWLTVRLAGRLGGGSFARMLAGTSMLVAPVFLRTGNMLHLPGFEALFWVSASYLIVRIIHEKKPKGWLWVGVVSGLGLLNKHSMLLFGFGLLAGLLLTAERRELFRPWIYSGGLVAILVFAPNLAWQIQNDWPTLDFLRALNANTMAGISPLQFVFGQILYLNPATAPLWLAGLYYFFFTSRGRPVRVLGWVYVVLFLLLILVKSKIYYLSPAYPVLLAAGGVEVERWTLEGKRRRFRPVAAGALILFGLLFAPVSLPVLPIDATDRYVRIATLGALENVFELTGDLHGQFGWTERVEAVAEVYHQLSDEEKSKTVIMASWYGPAAAIDYFGKRYRLPKAVSTHLTYHHWGLPDSAIEIMVGADMNREALEHYFNEVTVAKSIELRDVNPGERHFEVTVSRDPKQDLHQLWPSLRRW